MTGYEQVRSIAAELAGDHVAGERVELIMAETGVRRWRVASLEVLILSGPSAASR
jgi:hypothetical protein